ncbi:MAG: large conductance mechanosensitive channel protein MscL [Chloroflexi bacterium]|nr:large conductance mechanosensitive channel protein MscL [Chloroflexota bacterium]
MLDEFKKFIARGSVLDLAVGVIIGAAFTAIVTSLVQDILMPLISLITGGIDFTNNFIVLRTPAGAGVPATLEEARKAGAVAFAYGSFIQAIINFAIVAFVIFLIVQQANRLKGAPPPAAPDTKPCPYCFSAISIKATRCPNCTSQLK